MTSTATCKAITKAGRSCQSFAVVGSDFCFLHDPARASQAAAARRAGGYARHGRTVGPVGDVEPVTLASIADVVKLLEETVNDCRKLENSLARARALGSLAGVAISAITTGEFERRLAALEAKANEKH